MKEPLTAAEIVARDAHAFIVETAAGAADKITEAVRAARVAVDAINAPSIRQAPACALSFGTINVFAGMGGGKVRTLYGSHKIPPDVADGDYDAVLLLFPKR